MPLRSLRALAVVAIDCQASGTTPAHGDLLELGWATCSPDAPLRAESRWVVPRLGRPISQPIRELTGWTEACLEQAVAEDAAWAALQTELARLACGELRGAPTVIHYARFELPFLRDLHERLSEGRPFPFDVVCLHAIATRLFPDLPKHNIRALAGYLGHSPEQLRRSQGHVEATAFIWRALVPHLEQAGISDWDALQGWLADRKRPTKSGRRTFALDAAERRALPDRPGVYRFLRHNGQVVYVGKATSLKKRVASHFKSRGPAAERSLELLCQVHALEHVVTDSLLEAALLESDEIKRLDPPYNVQLRSAERQAWFATADFATAAPRASADYPIGPLPSERAVSSLAAFAALLDGVPPSRTLCSQVLAVPAIYLPDSELFQQGLASFAADLGGATGQTARARLLCFARALWIQRGRAPVEPEAAESAPELWDLARVRRRLERNLVQAALLVRRACFLNLLVDANVGFREANSPSARAFVVTNARIEQRLTLASLSELTSLPRRQPQRLLARKTAFDAAAYDRLRVLLTELHRIREEGGEVALVVGRRCFFADRLASLMRPI